MRYIVVTVSFLLFLLLLILFSRCYHNVVNKNDYISFTRALLCTMVDHRADAGAAQSSVNYTELEHLPATTVNYSSLACFKNFLEISRSTTNSF